MHPQHPHPRNEGTVAMIEERQGGVHEEDTTAGEVLAPLEYSNVQCEPEQRLRPDMRPPTRGRGYEERPGTELGAGLFRAGAGAGAAPARRKVVHVDHHHVHHHHHFHGAQNVDGLPSDASELRRHELSAEHQAEQRLEPRSVAPNTARPSRGHRQAAARRAARSRQVDFESSLTSELGRLQTSTFSTFGGAPVDLASKASCFMATSVLERERKTPPELQLQEYFELMSSLPMETRLKLSPYSVQLSKTK
ncbi:unnamed protein product [Durusdinium trenchii]|uniref:Uncharacterized protein n=1 Tax=Durusdinium trenchii TaxID=1381693 RepID=A0ABP0SGZ3_9DINO